MVKPGKLTTALLILPAWMGVTLSGGLLQPHQPESQATMIADGLIIGIAAASIFLVLVIALLRWDRLGFQRPEPPRSILLTWLPLLYISVLLGLSALIGLPPAGTVAIVFVNCLFVGFSEEVMFRAILFRGALSRLRIWPAVLLTSFIFGLIHTLNVFATGLLLTSLAQAVAAFMSGLLYLAIRIRTRSVWPMIVVHALWDFSLFMIVHASGEAQQNVDITASSLLVPMLLVLPLFGYGFFLLRHLERDFGWMSEVRAKA